MLFRMIKDYVVADYLRLLLQIIKDYVVADYLRLCCCESSKISLLQIIRD